MLLNEIFFYNRWEIQRIQEYHNRGLTIEIMAPKFSNQVMSKIGGKVIEASYDESTKTFIYDILFSTEEDAKQAKKILRRLQRGKPRIEVINISNWSARTVKSFYKSGMIGESIEVLENINPGSGSPIGAGSQDLTPLSDKQKHQLLTRKSRFWRMSILELKDELLLYKNNIRKTNLIRNVIKTKRKEQRYRDNVTQPTDSWIGGGTY